jgi:hypothetical protein
VQLASSHQGRAVNQTLARVDASLRFNEKLIDVRRNQLSLIDLRRHLFNRLSRRSRYFVSKCGSCCCFAVVRRIGIDQFLNLISS